MSYLKSLSWLSLILGILSLVIFEIYAKPEVEPYMYYVVISPFIIISWCLWSSAKAEKKEEKLHIKMPDWKVRKLMREEMNILFRDLNDPAGRRQTNAIIRLGNMGDESAIPHLEKLLKKDSSAIKKLAESAINKIKGRYTIIKVCAYLELDSRIIDRAVYFYHEIMKDQKKESLITNNILLVAFCLIMTVLENKDLAPVTVQDIIKSFKQLEHEISIRDVFELALKIIPKYKEMFNKNRQNNMTKHTKRGLNFYE